MISLIIGLSWEITSILVSCPKQVQNAQKRVFYCVRRGTCRWRVQWTENNQQGWNSLTSSFWPRWEKNDQTRRPQGLVNLAKWKLVWGKFVVPRCATMLADLATLPFLNAVNFLATKVKPMIPFFKCSSRQRSRTYPARLCLVLELTTPNIWAIWQHCTTRTHYVGHKSWNISPKPLLCSSSAWNPDFKDPLLLLEKSGLRKRISCQPYLSSCNLIPWLLRVSKASEVGLLSLELRCLIYLETKHVIDWEVVDSAK